MKTILLVPLFIFYLVGAKSQTDGKSSPLDSSEYSRSTKRVIHPPLFFVDSALVTESELGRYNPKDISAINVYKDSSAFKLAGDRGKYGLVYIETKKFAKRKYWIFFTSKSDVYSKWVPTPESDSAVVYILNNKILTGSFENNLSKIDNQTFVSLNVIDAKMLLRDFHISDRPLGVVIVSRTP